MDLLGQYGSDDDSSSSASDRSKSPPPSILKKTALPPGIPSPSKPAATKVSNSAATATATTAVSRRGKKLVSLHSVLPPHILGQLTKSEFEDDSSDEEANNHTRNQGKAGASEEKNSNSNNKKKTASQDEGIASFLSALGAAKTNKIVNKTSTATKVSESGSSKLGAAFVSVTSTTTTRKKKDGAITITTTNSASARPHITIPNGPSSVSSNEERRTPTAQGEPVAGGGSPSGYTPLSLSPRTAFHPFRNSAAVSAAPSVPNVAAAPAQAPRRSAPPVFHQQHHQPQQMPHQPQQHLQSQPSPMQAPAPPSQAHYNPRSKKRKLQKALRAGQLDQALDSATSHGVAQVEQLDQARPTEYVPQSETYAVPTHGVRVAATEMYNPKAGTTTQADAAAISKKGKNQINALMASAATFELQQARGGPAGKGNSQRAGAKKKYGW